MGNLVRRWWPGRLQRHGNHHRLELVTGGASGCVLLLDGWLQLDAADEALYHAALVRPVMGAIAAMPGARVLIVGGGDGCAARDVLTADPAARVTIVDHEQEVLDLAATHPTLCALNRGALMDARVSVRCADALAVLAGEVAGSWDAVICDLPDMNHPGAPADLMPRIFAGAGRALAAGGGIGTHLGSPFIHTGWTAAATAFNAAAQGRECAFYTAEIPSFGATWSFAACAARRPVIVGLGVLPLRWQAGVAV